MTHQIFIQRSESIFRRFATTTHFTNARYTFIVSTSMIVRMKRPNDSR
jgi:hypothetical protein